MKQNRSVAVTLLPLLSNAAAMHTLLVLFAFRDGPIADHGGMVIWWVSLLVCHMVLSVFLRKPREMRSVILLCAAMLAVQLGVTVYRNPVYPTFAAWVFLLCMWAYGYYQCAKALLLGVKPEELTVNFETTAVTMFVAAAIGSADAMSLGTVVHLAVGMLCILIALMRLRTLHTRMDDLEKQPMVGLLVPVILVAAAFFAILFCVVVSERAAELLSQFTAWLLSVLRALAQGIGAFIYWLFSLLPAVENPVGEDGFAADALPGGVSEMAYVNNGVLLYILIGALVAALGVSVVLIWRKVRLQSYKERRTLVRAVVVKKSGLWEILRRLLMGALQRVRYEVRYMQSFNSLPGLLIWLERRMGRRGVKRKVGETTAVYLKRIGEKYPEGRSDLTQLSKCLDQYYFGNGMDLPKETIRNMRKTLRNMKGATKQPKN